MKYDQKKSLNIILSKLMYCLIIYFYKVYHTAIHQSLSTECSTCNPKRHVSYLKVCNVY